MSFNCSCCPPGYGRCDFHFPKPKVVVLSDSGLFPDRNCLHKNMGPAENFPCCGGRGIQFETVAGTEDDYIPDYREIYCQCAAGREKKRVETPPETVDSIAAELARAGKVPK